MRADLNAHPNLRDVTLRGGQFVTGIVDAFEYDIDKHEDLESCFKILENHGLLKDLSDAHTYHYRLTERFATYLKG